MDVKAWKILFIKKGVLSRPSKNATRDVSVAVAKVFMQMRCKDARHGIIWLPRSWYQPHLDYKGLKIVFGGPKTLRAVLQGVAVADVKRREKWQYSKTEHIHMGEDHRVTYEVKFPSAPLFGVREALKTTRFYWNPEQMLWQAVLPKSFILSQEFIGLIKKAGGIISFINQTTQEKVILESSIEIVKTVLDKECFIVDEFHGEMHSLIADVSLEQLFCTVSKHLLRNA